MHKIFTYFSIILLCQCGTPKEFNILADNQNRLYPIGIHGLWGFANENGDTVIEPVFEEVSFFNKGISAVKYNDKYGFITPNGTWEHKPKFDTSYHFHCVPFMKRKNKRYYIDCDGKKNRQKQGFNFDAGGCMINLPTNPEKYFTEQNGNYQILYNYYELDDEKPKLIKDSLKVQIDSLGEFSSNCVLIFKDKKVGLFDVNLLKELVIKHYKDKNQKLLIENEILEGIQFKYDEIKFTRFRDNEVTKATFRIQNKWGLISGYGKEIFPALYESIRDIKWNMALVEYAPNCFGYKEYNGKEFFKKK